MRKGGVKLSVCLILVALTLSFASNITYEELNRRYDIDLVVKPFSDIEFEINTAGIAIISANVPRGLEIYVLSSIEYIRYVEYGVLPRVYIDHENERVRVENPKYIVVKSNLNYEIPVTLEVKIFTRRKPYIILAPAAYFLLVTGVAVLLMEALKTLERTRIAGNGTRK
jgi:hypothetical protein